MAAPIATPVMASSESGVLKTRSLPKRCCRPRVEPCIALWSSTSRPRSEEHTSELQSLRHLVCRLLLEKKNTTTRPARTRRAWCSTAAETIKAVCWNTLTSTFFFNDTATTEIYTLSLHDALPIYIAGMAEPTDADLNAYFQAHPET